MPQIIVRWNGWKSYSRPDSPDFIELKETRKNQYLSLSDNMYLYEKIVDVLDNDLIIISIGSQHLRSLAKELNGYNIAGKTFFIGYERAWRAGGQNLKCGYAWGN